MDENNLMNDGFVKSGTNYYSVFIPVIILISLGLVNLWEFTPARFYVKENFGSSDPLFLVKQQLLWLLFGVVAMLLVKYGFPSALKYRWCFVVLTPLLLWIAFVPGIGPRDGGMHRYIEFMGINFNTGLWAILLSVPAFSAWLNYLDQENPRRFAGVGLFLWIFLIIGLLIEQRNLPMMVLFCAVVFGMVMGARQNKFKKIIVAGTALILLGAFFAFSIVSAPYRFSRVKELYNYQYNPLGYGYQTRLTQSDLRAGGFVGQGLGSFSDDQNPPPQPVMPYTITTFMLQITARQFGLCGVFFVVLLVGSLGAAGSRIARRHEDDFVYMVKMGALLFLLAQPFFSIVRTYNLLPFIPSHYIPFFSYGLEPTLAGFVVLGILSCRHSDCRIVRNALPDLKS